ncbi:MAG: glutamyl-tRNA reductase, partial [Gemmatimonadaceae bacterium]
MHFVVIGLSQQTAPVAIREQVAVAPGDLPEALDSLHAAPIAEGFILSTCNRTEVYTLAGTPALALGAARGVLAGRSGGGWDGLVRYCYQHSDVAALRHLFRVACGLDSMVLGEGEILAQLRLALESARSAGLLAGVLGHVGAAALGCGKRVRSGTGIGRHALSIVSVALREAEQRLGAWDDRHVVVIGAGTTAELALKHLAALG